MNKDLYYWKQALSTLRGMLQCTKNAEARKAYVEAIMFANRKIRTLTYGIGG